MFVSLLKLWKVEYDSDNCGMFCIFPGKSDKKLQGTYLSESVNKILYSDGRGIGVRSDYNGVLLLDTILQRPVFRTEDVVKLELLLSEAVLLLQCLQSTELPGVEHVQDVLDELSSKIVAAQNKQKKGAKAQKLRLHSVNKDQNITTKTNSLCLFCFCWYFVWVRFV